MLQEGLEPNVVTYNGAISACDKTRQLEKMLELLAELRHKDRRQT